MKTEMEKCLAGEWYDCHDPFFMDLKSKAHHLLMKYNSLPYEQKTEKYAVLKEMFGSIGANVSVGHSFICDYGCNIHIGDNVTVNTGCTFVDCNKITIGNNVLVAPNVQIYTATHPVEFNERLVLTETPDGCKYVRRTFALPVMIEDGCWIGGGVIILPGVTIGQKCVIGAGSVVTKDIPANSRTHILHRFLSESPPIGLCKIYGLVSLIINFRSCYHFIIEKVKELIHFIKTQRFLSLFEVSHKAQSYPRLQRKFFLRQVILLSQQLDRSREIIHKHLILYLFGYKVNINISHYTTRGIIYFIVSIIISDKV